MSLLPLCGPESDLQQVEVDAGIWGRFRVTYEPFKQAHRGWPTRWFWIAKSAERLDVES